MQTLDTTDLAKVIGGATTRSNDLVMQQITQLSSTIKDVANKPQDNSMMLLVLAMTMGNKQSTVVAGGGAPVAGPPPMMAAAGGPAINIRTRVRV
jgi:hypothetical protein